MKIKMVMILVVTTVIALVGCRENVSAKFQEDLVWDDAAGHYVNERDANLVLWHDNKEYCEEVLKLWEAKYPDVTLTYEIVPTADSAAKMQLDGPAGLGADVFYMPHNHVVTMKESEGLFQLSARDKQSVMSRMQESAYQVLMHDNELFGIPSTVENIALLYNKQILIAIPPLPTVLNTTANNLLEQIENEEIYMEELLEGIAKWDNNFAGTGVTIPYLEERISDSEDRHTLMAWQLYDAYHNYPFLTRNGYRVFGPSNNDPSMFDITSAKVEESVYSVIGSWYGDKDSSDLFPGLANIEDLTWDQGPGKFQKGQVAITISGPWVLGDIQKNWEMWTEEGVYGYTSQTEIDDIYGVTPLPKFNNGQNPITFSGVQVTGMNIYTFYPNAAMNLLNFMSSTDVMNTIYSELGKVPAVSDSSVIPGLNEDVLSEGFLRQAEYSHPMPVIQEGNFMWDPLRDLWTNIFNEQMSVADALAKSEEDYNRILSDSGSN